MTTIVEKRGIWGAWGVPLLTADGGRWDDTWDDRMG